MSEAILNQIQVRAAAIADLAERNATKGSVLGSPDGLSVGRAMASMIDFGLGPGGYAATPVSKDPAAREWARSFACAETVPENLRGVRGHFASRFGFRDCFMVDYQWLRAEARTLTTAGGKGGYGIDATNLPTVDPLWQDSVAGVLGVSLLEGIEANAEIPRGTGGVTTSWISLEGSAPAAQDAGLGLVSIAPRTIIGTVKCSLQLLRQAPSINDFLGRLLIRSARQAIDKALLQGSGASGEPQGLANLPTASGIQQVSGTSLAWSGVLNAQRLAAASGVSDPRMAWVGAPTVRETLAAREKVSTAGRFIWDDNQIAGMPAFVTPDAPASTLFVGDFSQALVVLFGPGIEIRFDSRNNFDQGLVAFQVLCMCDIVFLQPSAFVRIASIT